MDIQNREHLTPDPVTLPADAFSELCHRLTLAFSQSFDQGLEGQHFRTAVSQFLYHLELSGSLAGEALREQLHRLSLINARRVLNEA